MGLFCAAAYLLALCACTPEDQFTPEGQPKPGNPAPAASGGALAEPEYVRTPPPVAMPEAPGTNQTTNADATRSGFIDVSNINKGYVAAQCSASVRCRVRIRKGEEVDDYELSNDGSTSYYPITRGNGEYTVILYTFLRDGDGGPEYDQFISATATAALESEFGPYIVPTRLVEYTPESPCVVLSHEITQHAATDLEVIQQIYYWITENISYDTEKATELAGKRGAYEPNPDETLASGKGICYDYASLAAAMLRANAIPAKLIKGDVDAPDGSGTVYHAWNMVWTEETGWIAVELATNPDDWTRVDATFGASGAMDIGSFIGNGENYVPTSES